MPTCLTINAQPQNDRLRAELQLCGLDVTQLPLHEIAAPKDGGARLQQRLASLDGVAWVTVSSQSCVSCMSPIATVKVAAVGEATADALRREGVRVDLVADGGGESLAKQLCDIGVCGKTIVSLQADTGRDEWHAILRDAGATVEKVPAYRLVMRDIDTAAWIAEHRERAIDAVAFTAPSSVEGFIEHFGSAMGEAPFAHTKYFAIGSTTEAAIAQYLACAGVAPARDFRAFAQFIAKALATC